MPWTGAPSVAAFSHGVAALAFLPPAALLLWGGWRRRRHATSLGVACLATTVWAACAAAYRALGAAPFWLLEAAESLRTACWLALLLLMAGGGLRLRGWLAGVWLALAAGLVAGLFEPAFGIVARLALAVLGMLLVEHVYRSAPQGSRWGIKFACLGVGAMFAYDFYLYSDAALFRQVNPDLWAARGIVNALSVPPLLLAAARNPVRAPGLLLSRQIMFRSAALLGSALYLLAMAASAWYLRYVGGAWGPLMQLACLCGAALLLAAVLFSGTMRARLKIFISKHFYQGRYDYRHEWRHVTRTLADGAGQLSERAIQAVAGLVESPAGLLWLRGDDDRYRPVAGWNMTPTPIAERPDGALCRFLTARNWVIELPEWRSHSTLYAGLALPDWLAAASDLWLVVPLKLERDLFGFICLAPPRTSLQLNWEVRDVLKIAGSQAASYLAHRASADSLAVSRQFESFNRMSTFIAHDLKTLMSQLSLLLVNAERHKANPAFQSDMLETLSHSLAKMRHLLLKLRRDDAPEAAAPLRLDHLLVRVMRANAGSEPLPSLELNGNEPTVLADPQRLERVIGHLVQNAVEATPRDGSVALRLRLRGDGAAAILEVCDSGHGMTEQFMRERLFKPFESTKTAGMGIGVFESREYLREIGGSLDVASAPLQGTTFRLTLPLHKELNDGQE
ncbi:XrtA/PEP-CTERM system histidine kinase PrsK [Duganella aceris]|uniref:histidine kinase n=1 Tax=Duganella aceris TaxID=2703883 RepID=A0ABX0FRS9_9BURK|nr:XrtA/PEP-CTERM system histidine kinase PrsK [Duganella aceris]NGZ87120.1 PEP-CTERM system histidine kinase PrsK [Duganella aceris]